MSEQSGRPTSHRLKYAPDGFEERGADALQQRMLESGSSGAQVRSRARTPIDLMEGAISREEQEALIRFAVGSNLGLGKYSSSSFDGVPMGGGSYARSRLPFVDWEAREIEARQYVYHKLDTHLRTTANVFLRASEHAPKALSMAQFGGYITASNDARVCRGGAIGVYRSLAWRMIQLYSEFDKGQALSDTVKRRLAALHEEERQITDAVTALRKDLSKRVVKKLHE